MSSDRHDFERGARLLFRIGLGLLLLSLLFLFRFAVVQGWIGPAARIALGAAAGAALVGLGLFVPRRVFAVWLEGTGVAAWYVTVFAAHRLYGMSDTSTALVQLAVVSAVAVGLAVHQRAEVLAVVGLLGALTAPVIIPGRIVGFPGDYGYIAAVLAVAAVLYLRSGWAFVLAATVLGGGFVVFVDLLLRLFDTPEAASNADLQFGIAALWLVGWAVPVGAALAGRFSDFARRAAVPAVASVLVPIPAFAVSRLIWVGFERDAGWTAVAAGFAVVHGSVAVADRERLSRSVQALLAVVFASITVGSWLSDEPFVVAFAAVGVVAVLTARRVRLAALELGGHAVSVLAWLVWVSWLSSVSEGSSWGSATAMLLPPALWAAAAVDGSPSAFRSATGATRAGYGVAAHVGVMVWALFVFADVGSGAAVTAVWGAVGIAEVVAARSSRSRLVTTVGFGTVLVAVGKLLLVDMATVEPVWRILSFAGFGLALSAVGYWLGSGGGGATDDGSDVADD